MGKIKINIPRILISIIFIFASIQAFAASCPIKIGGLAPLSAPGSVTGGEAMREAILLS